MQEGQRQSPSGRRVQIQLPFYGASGFNGGDIAGSLFVPVGGGSVVASDQENAVATYLVLQKGRLHTLLVRNVLTGADAVNVSYRVRYNGASLSPTVLLPNNGVGPMKIDLSEFYVLPGDTLGIILSVPSFSGSAPVPKIGFTWTPSP